MRLLIILGTRPEMIKLAPIIRECKKHTGIEAVVCSTGQHDTLLDGLAVFFEISIDIALHARLPGQSLTSLTIRCLEQIHPVIEQQQPDFVMVQGDTATAMSGALAAFQQNIPVVHVEAGLRTYDIQSPFPEEMYRRLITLATQAHMAPTRTAVRNLVHEGVDRKRIFCTGNTSIDALQWAIDRQPPPTSDEPLVLVTGHRRENIGNGLYSLCKAIRELAARHKVKFIWPLHPNPHVASSVQDFLGGSSVQLIPPAEYKTFVGLLQRAVLVITDSGGVQEEAVALGKPVLITRVTTERAEAIEHGAALLVGTDEDNIIQQAEAILSGSLTCENGRAIYGNGNAAGRIVHHLSQLEADFLP